MKITKLQLREMIREAINEQIGGGDIVQQNLGKKGKELADVFVKSMSEAIESWYALHYYMEPSEETDEAIIKMLDPEIGPFAGDENLLGLLDSIREKAMADL